VFDQAVHFNPKRDVPNWLWHSARLALVGVIGLGAIMVILLAGGIANPPRAGRAIFEIGPLADSTIPPNYTSEFSPSIALPRGAFTLEVEANVTGDAHWGILFDDQSHFGVEVNSRGFFSVPPYLPDSMPFIHIRAESNRVALNVESSGQATLRINDEIAWRGINPAANAFTIYASGGKTQSSRVRIQRVAVYAP
jgi:hypothetical protein